MRRSRVKCYQEQRKVSKKSMTVSCPTSKADTRAVKEEEYWAADPSFSDEALHALADAGDYLLGEIVDSGPNRERGISVVEGRA
jgi:hypothetical protein